MHIEMKALGAVGVAACALAAGCGGGTPAARSNDTAARAVASADTVAPAPAPAAAEPLDSATRAILAFLRREKAFSTIELADSVDLYVGRDAGGTRTRYARMDLQRPSLWVARSSRGNYRLVPPSSHPVTTMKRGAHFICNERKLSESFPELARKPHVGVLLEPEFRESCAQAWNVTFVFDDAARPRLVAAVYDQFEW
jgi:hypothetical protein